LGEIPDLFYYTYLYLHICTLIYRTIYIYIYIYIYRTHLADELGGELLVLVDEGGAQRHPPARQVVLGIHFQRHHLHGQNDAESLTMKLF